jgi:poly(A) polymerase
MSAVEIPAALIPIREVFKGTPFEGRVLLAGGAVRDRLLGDELGNDIDLVVEGDSLAAAQLIWEKGLAIAPPQTYPRFGTALLRLPGVELELAWARKESYDAQSRKPFTEAGTLIEDAFRRDFTVNALMQRLDTGEVVDLTGQGLTDLENKVLRTPLDPAKTFYDDPLRMLRAVRFRHRLGFEYAAGLADAIQAEAHRLSVISGERIRDEVDKMLILESAPEAMQDLLDLGLLDQFVPEFRQMVEVEQGRWHHLDVWQHTLLVLRNISSRDPILRWAALLHDVAKPATRIIDEHGQTRFFGHETLGATMARDIMLRLKYSTKDAEIVASLVKNHMRLGTLAEPSKAALRRLIRDMGEQLEPLIELVEADAASLRPGVRALDLDDLKKRLAETEEETPRAQIRSPLSGNEIMALLGIEASPRVGEIKHALEELVVEGTLAPDDREGATLAARRLAASWNASSG